MRIAQRRWFTGGAFPRLLAVLVMAMTLLAGAVPARADDGGYRVMIGRVDSRQFPDVRINATVLDNQFIPVTNLKASDWELLEDGQPVPVDTAERVQDIDNPIAVVLGIDVNAGMDGKPLRDTKDAASDFVFNLLPQDEVAALSFGDGVKLLHRFSNNKPAVVARIRELQTGNESTLYDAVLQGLDMLAQQPSGRKVMLFLSDGQDTASRARLADVLARASEARVPIFTIGLGTEVNMDALRKISDASGGVALYAPTSEDVLGAYQTVANHLRSEYALTFRSKLKADGARHTLTVRPRIGNLTPTAQVPFTAVKNPPVIEVVTPAVNAEVADTQPVEVRVSGIAPVVRVEFSTAGKLLGSLTEPPYRIEWDTRELKGGQQTLNITAVDSVDNRSTKFLPVVVPQRQVVPRTLQTTSEPVVNVPNREVLPVPEWALIALAGLPAAYLLLRVSGRVVRAAIPLRCSTHRVTYRRGTVCPLCAAESQTTIDNRLRRFAEADAPEGALTR